MSERAIAERQGDGAFVAERTAELARLCQRYGVRRLDLFGSAATGRFRTGDSDLDFVVEFQPATVSGAYADAYFGLLESLERLYGRPVDLVIDGAIRNPYFRQSVEATRMPLYAA